MHDRKPSYEGRIRPEATVDDLDIELAASFLGAAADGDAESAIAELERYGLITSSGEGWKVTNAALLLFAREPADRWHPQAGIAVFRVTGTRRLPGRTGNVNRAGRADPPWRGQSPRFTDSRGPRFAAPMRCATSSTAISRSTPTRPGRKPW